MEIHENINYLNNKAEHGEKWRGKENNNSACASFDHESRNFNTNPARNLIYEEIVDVKRGGIGNLGDSNRFEIKSSKFDNDGTENRAFTLEENRFSDFPRKKLHSPKHFDTDFDFKPPSFLNDYRPLDDLVEDDYSKINHDSDSDDMEEHIYMEPSPLPGTPMATNWKPKHHLDAEPESIYQNVTNKTTRPPSDLDLSDYDNLELYRRKSSTEAPKLPPLNHDKRISSGSHELRPLSAGSTNGLLQGIGKKPVPAKRKKKKSVLKKLSEEKQMNNE